MRIVIRADAGRVPEIGTGHLLRDIKLANALKTTPEFGEAEILFATRLKPPYELGGKLVNQAGFLLIEDRGLDPNSKKELESLMLARPDLVIFDRLETSSDLILALKNAGIFVVNFDDLGEGRSHANLVINSLFQNVESGPNIYIGYEYLFLLWDNFNKSMPDAIASKVFVSFGGYDSRRLNNYFLNSVPKIQGPDRYEIVTSGLSSNELNNFKNMAKTIELEAKVEIFVHQRPVDYYNLLCTSDLAVVSGGLTAFDCAQAGVPAVVIPQYEHQVENILKLEKLGCLKMGTRKMELDSQLISSLVTKLSEDYKQRSAMHQAGLKVIDGQGLSRVIDLITQAYCRE